MKQILQNVKDRSMSIVEVPPPALLPRGVRVRTAASLISAGTEKMLIDLASKSLVGKAQARPDLVKQVVEKARKEGLVNTFRNVISKLERPMPLGYSAAGIVEAVGSEVSGLNVGDAVAIAGAGYANHADVNFVPANLVAKIPDGVSFDDAAYATVGAIALQGVRLARPEIGDYVAVVGLGLIGLITVQILKANGCRVIGIDLDPQRVALGTKLGMDEGCSGQEDVIESVRQFTGGRLCDHTLITAATKSNGPIETAGEITRRRGQVVVVGAVGMSIPRDSYYKKELEIKVSMSYGPGRYDSSYEEGGVDYPYDYVRWTEQRNMEAVLHLISDGGLDVAALTTHQFPFDKAMDAYDLIRSGDEPFVGIVLNYDTEQQQDEIVRVTERAAHQPTDGLDVAFVGAGNYAALHLIPHLSSADDVRLAALVTATGLNARQKAEKFGFEYCTTDFESAIKDDTVNTVFIATRHSTHAEFAERALLQGKHVFVEKPMVTSESELRRVIAAYEQANANQSVGLMVGLNRRFAPLTVALREAMKGGPSQLIYRVNSGAIPTTSWLHEPAEGGGMLVGEVCHFVDLIQFIAMSKPVSVHAMAVHSGSSDIEDTDNVTITMNFENGAVGTVHYSTIGSKSAAKERLEVFGGGRVAILDDFRRLTLHGSKGVRKIRSANQDKGQASQISETIKSFKSRGEAPIPMEELVTAMRVVFAARRSIVEGRVVPVEELVVADTEARTAGIGAVA